MTDLVAWWEARCAAERLAADQRYDNHLVYLGRLPRDGAGWCLSTIELLKRGHK